MAPQGTQVVQPRLPWLSQASQVVFTHPGLAEKARHRLHESQFHLDSRTGEGRLVSKFLVAFGAGPRAILACYAGEVLSAEVLLAGQAPGSPQRLLSLGDGEGFLALHRAAACPYAAQADRLVPGFRDLVCLLTTRSVVLMDTRRPYQPLLRWLHRLPRPPYDSLPPLKDVRARHLAAALSRMTVQLDMHPDVLASLGGAELPGLRSLRCAAHVSDHVTGEVVSFPFELYAEGASWITAQPAADYQASQEAELRLGGSHFYSQEVAFSQQQASQRRRGPPPSQRHGQGEEAAVGLQMGVMDRAAGPPAGPWQAGRVVSRPGLLGARARALGIGTKTLLPLFRRPRRADPGPQESDSRGTGQPSTSGGGGGRATTLARGGAAAGSVLRSPALERLRQRERQREGQTAARDPVSPGPPAVTPIPPSSDVDLSARETAAIVALLGPPSTHYLPRDMVRVIESARSDSYISSVSRVRALWSYWRDVREEGAVQAAVPLCQGLGVCSFLIAAPPAEEPQAGPSPDLMDSPSLFFQHYHREAGGSRPLPVTLMGRLVWNGNVCISLLGGSGPAQVPGQAAALHGATEELTASLQAISDARTATRKKLAMQAPSGLANAQ